MSLISTKSEQLTRCNCRGEGRDGRGGSKLRVRSAGSGYIRICSDQVELCNRDEFRNQTLYADWVLFWCSFDGSIVLNNHLCSGFLCPGVNLIAFAWGVTGLGDDALNRYEARRGRDGL